MKGKNRLHLNEKTIVAAVQCYLDSLHMPGKSPKVTGIYFAKDEYVVEIDDKKEISALSVQKEEAA